MLDIEAQSIQKSFSGHIGFEIQSALKEGHFFIIQISISAIQIFKNIQAAFVICGFGIRGFDYSQMQITRENGYF
jgi:hypothetical protein